MKLQLSVLASAAVSLISSFTPSARAQGAPSPPVAAVHARSTSTLDLRLFLLRLDRSRELGLASLNLRLQVPRQLAPYVEGHLGDGVVADRPDGALMIPGTPVGLNGGAGAGWLFTRGVDIGVDVHRFTRGYLSVALGWLRSSIPVGGFDASDRQVSQNVSRDAAVLKVGLSF